MNPYNIVVAAVGAGRMGRGIALSLGLAGASTVLIDIKPRILEQQRQLRDETYEALALDLKFLVQLGILPEDSVSPALARVSLIHADNDLPERNFDVVFESVSEHREAKETAFKWMSDNIPNETLIASTTSTFMVDDLAQLITHPHRYANAHWLNPAHLMPLVEISRGKDSSDNTVETLKSLLTAIGKIPIVCSASPGYIVPRIQALAMNEAARLAEENVASPADIDTAIRVGFGIRYAILGMLEFIDWGGGDILYYGSNYLSENVDKARYSVPDIINDNMHNHRNGITDGEGFYDYKNMDVASYRKQRMSEFVALLKHLDLMPLIR